MQYFCAQMRLHIFLSAVDVLGTYHAMELVGEGITAVLVSMENFTKVTQDIDMLTA